MTLTVADYRKMAGVTQAEMAAQMQVPFRTYQDIEAGKVTFRPLHETAAAMALIRIAAARQDTSFLPAGIKATLRLAASALPPE
ncbi:helix-turn-helix transcriptional regulator [Rhizobium sp. WYCCWR 11152]|uniref:helix-turn-helix domain-containing protein n=1 Tax=Rhizobium sp. WYCCWR 11152 TaxID=2692316 RepID=UPI001491F498|nr:helix-turn-helix transcriptional regulator [Rhizobium sp. WYCCWR 11152]NNU66551.1 helix-turn-helix transcriptional regulator [Rhizobium sp. WYCCWR 11152]